MGWCRFRIVEYGYIKTSDVATGRSQPTTEKYQFKHFKTSIQTTFITIKMAPNTKTQPWRAVWPPAQDVADHSTVIPDGLSTEEVTNQRAYGSHASNTKGRIVHINKNCKNA
jgi:hypothetical protein